MNKKLFEKKWIGLITRDKILRIAAILIILLMILTLVLISIESSYQKKIDSNLMQINDAELQLNKLEASLKLEEDSRDKRAIGRSFAPYEEIIPFISLLEDLFGLIDNDAKVVIRDNEKQIYINRYADYEVTISPKQNIPLLYRALNELHKSEFLTKVTDFNMTYEEDENTKANKLKEINLTIRLYFE